MSSRHRSILAALLLLGSLSTSVEADDRTAQQVRSLLSNSCFACHGPDAEKREGGFRLDDLRSMRSEADSGERPVVVGQPDQSELLRRITTSDEDERMPPSSFGKRLNQQEVDTIRQWILDGAEFPQHWSFVPPQRPQLPEVTDAPHGDQAVAERILNDWQTHPIDRFVLQRQRERGFAPSAPATKSELLRRLSLDLTGLPPTPAEVAVFEQDTSLDSYERQVDRLLASPAYGENWARKWLDLARYADSAGYADDPARTIWGYRDWTIRALNANMPVDQFTVEQLAGDLLPNPTPAQLVATAFHRNTMTNNEGGTNDEEFRSAAIVDRVNTTLAVWMGVTMACAQCHTHKYDPFTQEEYFQLYSILNQTQDADRKDESPVVELYSDAQMRQKTHWEQRVSALSEELKNPTPKVLAGLAQWESTLSEPSWSSLIPSQGSSKSKSDFVFDNHQIQVKPTGNNIVSDTYSLKLHTGSSETQRVHAIGLRTLPRANLPSSGAGLSSSGNFVITNISAKVIAQAPQVTEETTAAVTRPVQFTAAFADYSQRDFPAANVIDTNPATGWAVGGSVDASHLLTLIPSEPLELEPTDILEIEIEHKSAHRHHLLGSFSIDASHQSGVAAWSQLSPELLAVHCKPVAERSDSEQQQLAIFYSQNFAAENAPQREELSKLTERLAALKPETSVPVLRQLEPKAQRETFVQLRGNYKSLGAKVTPGTPAIFHPLDGSREPDRLALAKWLVDRRNPLTARVWVNRLWESLFGIGIVRTSEEFGAQGDRPSHPELLDWLACELMDSQWDVKRMLKLMVTSQTYRQTSKVSPFALEQDQENIWLARGPRVRLSAEMVRDQALSAAGLLTHTMYGPPVRPPQPNMGLKAAFGSDTDWKTSEGEDRYRRGIYTSWRRSNPYPSMATFDAPSREVCTLRRDSTNTPLQALVTLNDPGFVEAAQGLARLVVIHQGQHCSSKERLQLAFRRCTSRDASPEELEALAGLLKSAKQHFQDKPAEALLLATDPLGPLPASTTATDKQVATDGQVATDEQAATNKRAAQLAAWTAVCNVILNLDEVLMKR